MNIRIFITRLVLLFCVIGISSCKGNLPENGTVKTLSEDQSDRDTITCLDMVADIVKGSNFSSPLANNDVKLWIDNMDNNIITIKVTNASEEGQDVAIAWLELDLKGEELRDITIDPDEPQKLVFKKELLDKVKQKCH